MAPINKHGKNMGKQTKKNINQGEKHLSAFNKKKRKWVPEGKVFDGSVKEGQGFAFKRKQKAQHEYNKLLRKEKRRNPVSKTPFVNNYPDHLKHLYLAEAQKLRKEEEENERRRRRKGTSAAVDEDASVEDSADSHTGPACPSSSVQGDPTAPGPPQDETAEPSGYDPSKKKKRKLTSYQKTKEEYQRIQEKRAKKKEEALRNKQQREEALRIYKEKKMQTYQMLCKKTKKGQPNLNLQMEYLLQKIQGQSK
ncbi:hypothetical protein AGOR_G00016290 [Albula goreensis]|uniref:Thyroid transcription factor 1-associated protein 26 n=1 Tax=Albula goreensis TaxID=1534307 RepID=A0A8T3EB46_9TELE|nr:hypothetical protein AGOR_G00016290 [Albula goreensis]